MMDVLFVDECLSAPLDTTAAIQPLRLLWLITIRVHEVELGALQA